MSRVRASGTPAERRGILLVNPGGPGGSGLLYAGTKRAELPESVRRAYDVVGFDPRGVGRTTPVTCGPMGGLFDSPGSDPVPAGAGAERTYLASLRALADDCATHAGRLLPYLSTRQTAYDMEAIRAALGEPRTSFLGVSYGSYLGAAYTARFPHRVGRMVLDSVVGPGSWYDFDVLQSRALLRQRDIFFAWTAARAGRFGLGGTPAAVRDSYLRVRRELAARPVAGFGPAEFDRAVYRALGRTERWAGLADGLRGQLTDGDPDGLRPAGAFDSADSRNYEAANRVALLVASAHDPVTPIEGARRLQRLLPGSRLVALDDDYSHGVFASRGDACVDDTVAACLVRGEVPSANVRCTGPGLPTAR
ncbi:alpha/beta fold hydrolase [Streptomyces coeruleorubidus]|uniref:alpha/beta fold hydrolase n=1 Tax=Streptomyces coeruleorubidus TaxID=116188 RepID=UPI001E547599|nr:alpha/beta fold hydrolase [Streptomyces coeruleorubidus]